jgi:hypothetical protein
VQALPSLQAVPLSGTTVQETVPLQLRVLHWSLVQVIAVPAQAPALQRSVCVQALPSLQVVPVSGVTVQAAVPLHARLLHWSLTQTTAVPPAQVPPPLQVSPYVQASPSLQAVPVSGVTVQLAVPLHARTLH